MTKDLSGDAIAALYMENKRLVADKDAQEKEILRLRQKVSELECRHNEAYRQLAARSKKTIQKHIAAGKRLKKQVDWLVAMLTRYTLDEPSANIKSWKDAARKAVEEGNGQS